MTIRIGMLGDFNPEYPSHITIGTSLQHAVRALRVLRLARQTSP